MIAQPSTKLDDETKFPKQSKRLQGIFNSDKYWDRCFPLSTSAKLEALDSGELVIVFETLKLQFFLFGPPNDSYLGRGECTLVLDQTIEAVEDQARKRVKEITRSSANPRIGRIMEVFEIKVMLRSHLTIFSRWRTISKNLYISESMTAVPTPARIKSFGIDPARHCETQVPSTV